MTAPTPKPLTGLSPSAYEHPTDRAALEALRKLPGFDRLLKLLFGAISERGLRLWFLGNSLQVGPDQLPEVHVQLEAAARALDMPVPELYVAQSPLVNAGAIGVDQPFVVLYSGTLGLLTDDELRFVIGHELGHIKSDHALYKTMVRILLSLGLPLMVRAGLPAATWTLRGVVLGLLEWDRKSELSGDRAGLLAVQDPEVAYSALMKLAGGAGRGTRSSEAFLAQARAHADAGDLRDRFLKLWQLVGRSHPFAAQRAVALSGWVDDGSYARILDGDYEVGREPAPRPAVEADASAAREIAREMAKTTDPLVELGKLIGRGTTEAAAGFVSTVRDIFRPGTATSSSAAHDPGGHDGEA